MTRIELGTGVGASRFSPVDSSYSRVTKDGSMPIITYLLGTHYNEALDGILTATESLR